MKNNFKTFLNFFQVQMSIVGSKSGKSGNPLTKLNRVYAYPSTSGYNGIIRYNRTINNGIG